MDSVSNVINNIGQKSTIDRIFSDNEGDGGRSAVIRHGGNTFNVLIREDGAIRDGALVSTFTAFVSSVQIGKRYCYADVSDGADSYDTFEDALSDVLIDIQAFDPTEALAEMDRKKAAYNQDDVAFRLAALPNDGGSVSPEPMIGRLTILDEPIVVENVPTS